MLKTSKVEVSRSHALPALRVAVVYSALALPSVLAPALALAQNSATLDLQNLVGSPPRTLVVDVAAHETRAVRHADSFIRYRMHTRDEKGDRVRDIIESRDGTVARLILKDGRPLTPEEDAAERDRLNDMIASPSEFAKHMKGDANGKKLATDLIQLMPDAMLYTYTPGQPQLEPARNSRQIVLDYAPNPKWSPPNTTAQALTGLRGRMWIDAKTHELVRMEGEIFQAVNFGWGMLAHIYPGGKVSLDQVNVGGDRLIFSRFVEQVKVRALMVRSLNIDSTIEASGFRPVPAGLTYADAIRMLLATPLPGNTDAAASR